MRLRLLSAALVAAAPALLAAQGGAPAQPVANVKPSMPGRWQAHLDRATLPADYTVVTTATGLHATTVRAAGVFYDPQMTATGKYRAEATFTQTKAPMHPEAYGLVLGGSALDTDAQEYLYFVVRGDGKYLINHRAGPEVHKIVDWTASPALHAAGADGKATNALRVDVGADSVRFFANGAQVAALPHAVKTDGIVGVRVNHALDVQIDGLRVTPMK